MFYGHSNLEAEPTGWNKFPTEKKPTRKYKFNSIELKASRDLIQHNRQTYGILDWLGDCGGLMDALSMIGELITAPFSAFALNAKLASLLVRYQPKKALPKKAFLDRFRTAQTTS